MLGKVKIVTLSFPECGLRCATQEELRVRVCTRVAETANLHPDLICLPEEVLLQCGDGGTSPRWAENNLGLLADMQEQAKKLHSNILVCLEVPSEKYEGKRYNTVYAINREGEIIGKYRKHHITFRAFAKGGLPGERLAVFDMDIGKIGVMTCFDIGWREDWQKLHDMGAKLVYWNSAYDGGQLLNSYAMVHQYYIVTSVWSGQSSRLRIIDPLGDEIAVSGHWDTVCDGVVHMDTEIFHMDFHYNKIARLRADFGDRINLKIKDRDNMFLLSSNDPEWPVERIKKEYDLLTYEDYHTQSEADCAKARAEFPEEE